MKKYYFLIIVVLILGLVLTGCSLLSNIGQAPTTEQSGITYLTKTIPPSDDLVGLWHFDEGSKATTVTDSSGNENTGDIYGATPGEAGKFGNALNFDGVNDYVDCGAAVDDSITTDITLEAWIMPAFQQNGGIISNDITYSSKKGYDFFLWSGNATYGRLYIDFGNGFSLGRTSWAIPSPDWYNQWHHVAATWNGSEITLYADGSKVAEVGYSGTYFDPNKNTFVGAINYLTPANYYFKRLIDEVRIWNRALTGDEILYNYENSLRNVGIDIKPGSDPNSINLGSNGVVPVAILGSPGFDAATVNPSTVTLSGANAKLKGNSGNAGSLEDVNNDGYLDLVVQVFTRCLELSTGDAEAVLNAYTYTGLTFLTGSDVIRIVPPE